MFFNGLAAQGLRGSANGGETKTWIESSAIFYALSTR
jgi:hypothetical protein